MAQSKLGSYNEVIAALEQFDAEYFAEPAIEGVNVDKEMIKISDKMNTKLNQSIASYVSSMQHGQYDDALRSLTEIEVMAKDWKARLNAIPPERMTSRMLRRSAKFVSVFASIFILFHSSALAGIAMNLLAKIGIGHGATALTKFIGSYVMDIKAWGTIFNSINDAIACKGTTKTDRENYKDDPNAANKRYLKAHVTLDQWIQNIPKLRAEIMKKKVESGVTTA